MPLIILTNPHRYFQFNILAYVLENSDFPVVTLSPDSCSAFSGRELIFSRFPNRVTLEYASTFHLRKDCGDNYTTVVHTSECNKASENASAGEILDWKDLLKLLALQTVRVIFVKISKIGLYENDTFPVVPALVINANAQFSFGTFFVEEYKHVPEAELAQLMLTKPCIDYERPTATAVDICDIGDALLKNVSSLDWVSDCVRMTSVPSTTIALADLASCVREEFGPLGYRTARVKKIGFVGKFILRKKQSRVLLNNTGENVSYCGQDSEVVHRTIRYAKAVDIDKFLSAVNSNNVAAVKKCISKININTANEKGITALMIASQRGYIDIVRMLVETQTVCIDLPSEQSNTALHMASLAGHTDIVKLLLDRGANVNAQSKHGFTPLYMAAQNNSIEIVKLLLDHGADKSLTTNDGFTALSIANQQGNREVVTLLESKQVYTKRMPSGANVPVICDEASSNLPPPRDVKAAFIQLCHSLIQQGVVPKTELYKKVRQSHESASCVVS